MFAENNNNKKLYKSAKYENYWEDEAEESTFVIDKLGKINIDKILEIPGERVSVSVSLPTQIGNIFLVLANNNSFLFPNLITQNGAIYDEIPINKKYYMVIREIMNDKIIHLIKEIKPEGDLNLTINDFKPIKASDLSLLLTAKSTPQI